jgi:hypothetical protein
VVSSRVQQGTYSEFFFFFFFFDRRKFTTCKIKMFTKWEIQIIENCMVVKKQNFILVENCVEENVEKYSLYYYTKRFEKQTESNCTHKCIQYAQKN